MANEVLSDTWLTDLMATLPERKRPKDRYVKPRSVRELELAVQEQKRISRPGNPYPIKPKHRDDTANGLTKCIVAHLELNGCFAGRVNTQGTYNKKLGRFIKSGSKKGMADITSVISGKHVSIEVKIGKDKPREAQLKVKQQVEAAGGVYLFVSSYDDYLEQIKELL